MPVNPHVARTGARLPATTSTGSVRVQDAAGLRGLA